MIFEIIRSYVNLFRVLVILGILILTLLAFGISFIIKSMKINIDKTISFIHNIMAGIIGGIVVAILLDFKENGGWISYVIAGAFIIFVIGIITYSNMIYYKFKEEAKGDNMPKKKFKWLRNLGLKFKKTFNFKRFFKALLLAVQIGLGVYLSKLFLEVHWLLALIIVTLFLMIFTGKLLDILFP